MYCLKRNVMLRITKQSPVLQINSMMSCASISRCDPLTTHRLELVFPVMSRHLQFATNVNPSQASAMPTNLNYIHLKCRFSEFIALAEQYSKINWGNFLAFQNESKLYCYFCCLSRRNLLGFSKQPHILILLSSLGVSISNLWTILVVLTK